MKMEPPDEPYFPFETGYPPFMIDGVPLTAGSKVHIYVGKPAWWRFRHRRRWKKAGKDKQNGVYVVESVTWERSDPPTGLR